MPRFAPIYLIIMTAALTACAAEQPAAIATDSAPAEQTPPEAAPQLADVTPTLPQQIETLAEVGLSDVGPWLVMVAEDGLWAVNPDGTGLTQLYAGGIDAPDYFADGVSPSGGHIAFITSSPAVGGNESQTWAFDLHLIILNVLSGESFEAARLNTDETRPDPDDTPGDPAVEGYRAIIDEQSLAWSPDGLTLAFMGMIDGPTSDLYTYHLPTGEITRLTDGESQAFQPSWSPDGTYILHASAGTFGTGAGYAMDGVWAARADGTDISLLYEPDSADEEFVGWLGDTTILVQSWAADCGAHDLRRFEFDGSHSASMTEYFEGPGPAIDYASGAVLISVGEYTAQCNEDGAVGVFLLSLNELGGQQVWRGNALAPVWSEAANVFLVSVEGGVISVTTDGVVNELPAPVAEIPLISPNGESWAWFSDGFAGSETGLWIGPVGASTPIQVFSAPVYKALWSPDGARVFFFTDVGLFTFNLNTDVITPAGDGLFLNNSTSAVWMQP